MADETNGQAVAPAEGETKPVADETRDLNAPAPEAKPDEAKAAEPEVEDKGEEGEGETGEDGQPRRRKRTGSERAKRREEYLLNELRERERRLEELERQSPKGDGDKKDEPPKEEEFNGDWTAYVAARAAYEAGKAVEGKLSAREQTTAQQRQAEARRERDIAHLERIDEAKEIIADFDQVMGTMKGVTVREDVLEEIKSSDKSPLIAYHLAKNPDKLRELNSMSARELAREIGRLEGSLRMPAGKKQTGAPPPPTTLRGGAAPAVDLVSADMDAYVAARKAQGFK
jgi:hypothetical protein